MKGKRARHLLTYLLCACLLVSLLNGCGSNDSDNDGRGDIVEDQTPATVETVNAEDFYGCWKYTDLEDWVYIYGDGTYEWFEEDGSSEVGTYQMDGGELVMDDGLRYTLDGEGGRSMRTATPCIRLSCRSSRPWRILKKGATASIWRWTREGSPWKTLPDITIKTAAITKPHTENGR